MVNNQRRVTAVFSALSDPTRRRILTHLSSRGEDQVTALAKPFRISLPAISRHLRILEQARLIRRQRSGRVHIIRPQPKGLEPAQQWIAAYLAGWNFSFDALNELLKKEDEDSTP